MKRSPRFYAAQTMLMILLVFAAMGAAGETGRAPAAAHPEMVVSTAWLAAHGNDPQVVVLHIGKRSDYDQGHIPGARFISADQLSTGHVGLMVELPPEDQLQQALEEAGVSNDSRVVLYTTEWYPAAARGYFTFDYLGMGDHTALLDGGLQHWKAEHRAISTEPAIPVRSSFTPHLNPRVRAVLGEVQTVAKPAGAAQNTILVDARPQKRYLAGHLAGAIPLYWQDTIVSEKDPVLLPVDQLRALLRSRGVAAGHPLVTYCEVGLQAAHDYFVARYLGYDAALYDGSYYEWNQLKHLPVVTGDAPR